MIIFTSKKYICCKIYSGNANLSVLQCLGLFCAGGNRRNAVNVEYGVAENNRCAQQTDGSQIFGVCLKGL